MHDLIILIHCYDFIAEGVLLFVIFFAGHRVQPLVLLEKVEVRLYLPPAAANLEHHTGRLAIVLPHGHLM